MVIVTYPFVFRQAGAAAPPVKALAGVRVGTRTRAPSAPPPVKKEELEDYLKSYRDEREAGEKLADAYRVALQGVLTYVGTRIAADNARLVFPDLSATLAEVRATVGSPSGR